MGQLYTINDGLITRYDVLNYVNHLNKLKALSATDNKRNLTPSQKEWVALKITKLGIM